MVIVRPIDHRDRAPWERLWTGYQDFYGVALGPEITERTWQRLLDDAEPVYGLAAVVDGAFVGFAHYLFHRSTWMIVDTCYLQDLFVRPETRRQGVAAALIQAVYDRADAHGAGQVYWLTHETNTAARRVYDTKATACGFISYERFAEAPADP